MPKSYTLRFRCPCKDSNVAIAWEHKACGGTEEIYEDGFVRCRGCGKIFRLEELRFSCLNCPYNDFRRSSYVLLILAMLLEEINGQKFMSNLMINISKRL